MTCREMQELIHDHFEEGVGDDRQQIIFGHIAGCHGCRTFFDTIIRTHAAGQQDQTTYPAELDDVLIPVFALDTGRAASRRYRAFGWLRGLSGSPALAGSYPLVIILCAVMFGLGLLLKGALTPAPALVSLPPNSAVQPGTVIMIYGLPPVEVQAIPARNLIRQQLQQQE
jgi:hypothetical protein